MAPFLELAAKPQRVTNTQQRKPNPVNFAPPFGSTDHAKKSCEGSLVGTTVPKWVQSVPSFRIPPALCHFSWTSWSLQPAAQCERAAGLCTTCLSCQVMWESISINGHDYLIVPHI